MEETHLNQQPAESENLIEILALAIEQVVDAKYLSLEKLLLQANQRVDAALSNLQETSIPDTAPGFEGCVEGGSIDASTGTLCHAMLPDLLMATESTQGSSKKELEKEGNDKKDTKKDSKKDKKEKKPKEQKKVFVAYKINCLSDISAVMCTFYTDMKVFYCWTDEKLIGRKKGETIDYEAEKGLFDPDIQITNEHDLQEISNVTKIVDSATGEVKRTIQFKGTVFLLSMDLRSFPMDCQNLQICFKPYKLPVEEVLMVPKPPDECAMEHTAANEWETLGHCMKNFETNPAASSTGKAYSTLFVIVMAKRRSNWFVWNVFVPTAAFLLIAWLTFTFAADARDEKMSVSMNTLLSSIANKYLVADEIPKVEYRTIVDRYLDVCFFLQILTMLAHIIVNDFHELPVVGPWLNSLIFLFELVVAALFHEWMYARLHNIDLDVKEWVRSSQETNELNTRKASDTKDKKFFADDPPPEHKPRPKRWASLLTKMVTGWKSLHDDLDDGSMEHEGSPKANFTNFGSSVLTGFVLNRDESSLKESRKEKARLKDQLELEQRKSFLENLKFSSAGRRMLTAVQNKDHPTALNCAAALVQAQWRRLSASRLVRKIKKERVDFILHSSAVRIQRAFRMRKLMRNHHHDLEVQGQNEELSRFIGVHDVRQLSTYESAGNVYDDSTTTTPTSAAFSAAGVHSPGFRAGETPVLLTSENFDDLLDLQGVEFRGQFSPTGKRV